MIANVALDGLISLVPLVTVTLAIFTALTESPSMSRRNRPPAFGSLRWNSGACVASSSSA